MKTVTSLFLVALLVASAFADCVTRGPVDVYVGDHAVLDSVISCSGNLQSLALPAAQLGGHDALTFEVEVLPKAFSGCVFSYGSGADYVALGFALDANNQRGQVHFTVGTQEVSTQGVLTLNEWHHIAVIVRNSAPVAGGVPSSAIATIIVDGISYAPDTVGPLAGNTRQGHLGYCAATKTYFNGQVDNLIITAKAKDTQELADTLSLIFPFVLENDLVQMWSFNDASNVDETEAFTGFAADNVAKTSLASSADSSVAAVCTRVVKDGAKKTDVFCQQSGSIKVAPGSTVDSIQNVAMFQDFTGGVSQTFACAAGASFTFNQKWSNGGVTEATVKTSVTHRFRVAATVDGSLVVEHQSWGGWTRLSAGSGIIREDRSAFSISETQFVLQAANYGWIAFTQNGGFLNYQYALDKDACAAATCNYIGIEEFQYNFQNPPLPEPMGNQEVSEGILGLPQVLACPTPALQGYNPWMYCWGWWVGPQVGYTRDWNGNQWQVSDPGCCRNAAINDNQWAQQRWGYMTKDLTLPWCTENSVPPIAPPKGVTTIPTYPTDPCEGITTDELTQFKQVCAGLWGSDQTDGRYVGCVAQLCITKDPTTVPPPDCDTEKLLATLDSTFVISAKCNNACPGNCNFRGTCTAGVCSCDEPTKWAGPSCGLPVTYPCVQADGNKVLPFQLRSLDSSFPNAPVLSASMGDPIYTQFAWPGKYKIADSLFVYVAQSVESYTNDAATYHLWVVANNGAGSQDYSYQVNIATASALAGLSEIDMFGGASAVAGIAGASPAPYPNYNRAITGTPISIAISHKKSGQAGFVLRNLPQNFQATITVTGGTLPQVIIGGGSASQKAAMDVFRISNNAATNGFQIGGLGASGSTKCSDTPTCAPLTCAACTANSACGWCVETSQCQPGNAAGPAFGECLNWRKTFDAGVTRRVTQIPAYPANPGLTEVVLTTGTDASLPIDISVTPIPSANSEWDTVYFNDFGATGGDRDSFSAQIPDILSAAKINPNMGIAFASLDTTGYDTIKPISNPNAGDVIPDHIRTFSLSKIAPTTGYLVDVNGALDKLVVSSDLRLRQGTRKMALFTSTRDHDGLVSVATADALLLKNIVPVFGVSSKFVASYQQLVASIGFGYVFELNTASFAGAYSAALNLAGSSITAAIPKAQQASTHIDTAAYTTHQERFTITNLPTSMRARFAVPVQKRGADADNVQATSIVFPGYSTAVVENIPATRGERPWTTNGDKYSMLSSSGPQVIELTGMSFRGLMAVTPKIATLPAASAGVLYRALRKVVNGAPAYVAGDLIVLGTNDVITDARVVFLPKTDVTGTEQTTFTYTVADKCIASAPGVVSLEVTPANRAPQADMPNMVTRQFTALDFTLDFGDDKKSTGGTYKFNIIDTVASNDGALYKWHATFNPADLAASASFLITDNMDLTSARIIYMPTQYKYSDATRPELLILPCFTYSVTETSEPTTPVDLNLVSNVKQVLITVTHVNTPPYVWQQANPAWPGVALGLGDWKSYSAAEYCFDTCTFDEDFGEQFWWNAGFEFIYLGGDDIEGSNLDFQFTEVDCFPGTILIGDLSSSQTNLKVGDTLKSNAPGVLHNRVSFRPAPESSDSHTGKGYYCKISYLVIDDEAAVSQAKTITIHINDVNKQPHLEEEIKSVDALEQQKKSFFLEAVDPEGDAFTVEFHGCAKSQGVIELCTDKDCSNTIVLDCTKIYPSTPVVLANAVITLDSGATGFLGFFTSGPVDNFAEGYEYNTIYMGLKDGVSTFPATTAVVVFNVKIVNNPPKITINGDDVDTVAFTVDITSPFRPEVIVADADFEDEDTFLMSVELTIETETTGVQFNVDALKTFVIPDCADSADITERKVFYTCNLASVNTFLSQFQVISPQVISNGDSVTVTIVANDNGYSGQCEEITAVTAQPCPLKDTVTLTLTYAQVQDTSSVTVASSAAAAGVAGAAAIAAVALFRRFNKKAQDEYAPWDDSVSDDSTAVNPLYVESGAKGENPLFEAKADL